MPPRAKDKHPPTLLVATLEPHHLSTRVLAAAGVGKRGSAARGRGAPNHGKARKGPPLTPRDPLDQRLKRSQSTPELDNGKAMRAAGRGPAAPARAGPASARRARRAKGHAQAAHDAPASPLGMPAKPLGPRTWLKIDAEGCISIFKGEREALCKECGIPGREVRLLDPQLGAAPALLCRERALLVNLEPLQLIITQRAAFLANADHPAVRMFLAELQRRLARPAPLTHLPFELTAVEVALDQVCQHLERLAMELEAGLQPCFSMTTVVKLTSTFLESMRSMKARLVRLKTRVETIKEILEKYLGDEDDMREMYLSAKERQRMTRRVSSLARNSLRAAMMNLPRLRLHTAASSQPCSPTQHGLHSASPEAEATLAETPVTELPASSASSVYSDPAPASSGWDDERLSAPASGSEDERAPAPHPVAVLSYQMQGQLSQPPLISLPSGIERSPFEGWTPVHDRRREANPEAAAPPGAALRRSISADGQAWHPHGSAAVGESAGTQRVEAAAEARVDADADAETEAQAEAQRSAMLAAAAAAQEEEEREAALAEVEELLQAYRLALDRTWNKLQAVDEHVTDTEEFLDLEVDNYRNNILRMRVVLNAITTMGAGVFAVHNLFGMNIGNAPDRVTSWTVETFNLVTVLPIAGGLILMALFTIYLHYNNLGPTNITS